MAYLLRSLAVIGAIAWQSPLHGERAVAPGASDRPALSAAATMLHQHPAHSIAAAREAAEIVAGLDPQTRQTLTDLIVKSAIASVQKPSS